MSDRNAAQRARNARYKAEGRCRCGREPAPNRKSCAACLADDNKSATRRYWRKRDELRAKNAEYRARPQVQEAERVKRKLKWQAVKADPAAAVQRREKRYLQTFGLTLQQVEAQHDAQQGRCAICERAFTETGGRGAPGLGHVDHCHRTGKLRALLCLRCNMAVGKLEAWEAGGLLDRLCAYVLEHRSGT